MVRTIISLDPADKAWLDEQSRRTGRPVTELVRSAIREMRESEERSFDELLASTKGLWKAGDGLKYQRRLRREWR